MMQPQSKKKNCDKISFDCEVRFVHWGVSLSRWSVVALPVQQTVIEHWYFTKQVLSYVSFDVLCPHVCFEANSRCWFQLVKGKVQPRRRSRRNIMKIDPPGSVLDSFTDGFSPVLWWKGYQSAWPSLVKSSILKTDALPNWCNSSQKSRWRQMWCRVAWWPVFWCSRQKQWYHPEQVYLRWSCSWPQLNHWSICGPRSAWPQNAEARMRKEIHGKPKETFAEKNTCRFLTEKYSSFIQTEIKICPVQVNCFAMGSILHDQWGRVAVQELISRIPPMNGACGGLDLESTWHTKKMNVSSNPEEKEKKVHSREWFFFPFFACKFCLQSIRPPGSPDLEHVSRGKREQVKTIRRLKWANTPWMTAERKMYLGLSDKLLSLDAAKSNQCLLLEVCICQWAFTRFHQNVQPCFCFTMMEA